MTLILTILHPMQLDGQILGLITNVSELIEDKLHLLRQLAGRWLRAELDRLDERIVRLELLMQLVSCLYFEHVVTECYDVC